MTYGIRTELERKYREVFYSHSQFIWERCYGRLYEMVLTQINYIKKGMPTVRENQSIKTLNFLPLTSRGSSSFDPTAMSVSLSWGNAQPTIFDFERGVIESSAICFYLSDLRKSFTLKEMIDRTCYEEVVVGGPNFIARSLLMRLNTYFSTYYEMIFCLWIMMNAKFPHSDSETLTRKILGKMALMGLSYTNRQKCEAALKIFKPEVFQILERRGF